MVTCQEMAARDVAALAVSADREVLWGMRVWLVASIAVLVLGACTADEPTAQAPPTGSTRTSSDESTAAPSAPSETTETPASPTPTPAPTFDAGVAYAVVEHLAGRIGPREATSEAYRQAAADVQSWFTALGYTVTQVQVPVPAGVSWGVEVPAGTSANVIADSPYFDPAAPHVIVGAQLDTVPQAPGAEDNASGVGVMFALARMVVVAPPGVPVRFIAFAAEEPRGPGDEDHHFGSLQHVRDMPGAERSALLGMISIDRVGVATDEIPVCTGGRGATSTRDAVLAAAPSGVAAGPCENRTSDHWPFEKGGLPAARVGGVDYPEYHSEADVPSVVDQAQLDEVGRLMWAWLQSL